MQGDDDAAAKPENRQIAYQVIGLYQPHKRDSIALKHVQKGIL